jgi:RHS repeat-associated protein
MKISLEEIGSAYAALNLDAFNDSLTVISEKLNQIGQLSAFSGQGATAMKAYLSEVHGTIVSTFRLILIELDLSLKNTLRDFSGVDQSLDARIQQAYLEEVASHVAQFKTQMLLDHGDIMAEIGRARSVAGISANVDISEVDIESNLAERFLNETGENTSTFNARHIGDTAVLQSLLGSLEDVMESINISLATPVSDYVPGSFAKSPEGKMLSKNLGESLLNILNSGDLGAIKAALNIMGGFMAALSGPLRHIYQMLKGKAKLCAFGGDPVNMSTGNFIYSHVDIKIGGRYPLVFRRFYNSIDDYNDPLGKNWSHSFDIRALRQSDGVSIRFEDGHQEFFSLNDEGMYISPTGQYSKLEENSDGTLALQLLDSSIYQFSENGLIAYIADRNSNKIEFEYNNEKLEKVTSGSGSLSFEYNDGYIVTISDHASRAVSYEYAESLLAVFTDVIGNCYKYDYDDQKRLVCVIDPEGNTKLENRFDEYDRTVKQLFADSGIIQYYYNEEARAIECERQDGSKLTYQRDGQFRTTDIAYPDGTESKVFNDNNQVIASINRRGYKTQYEYDQLGHITKVTDALGYVTRYLYQQDNIISISREDCIQSLFEHDEKGNLLLTKDAMGRAVSIEYDKKGQPIKTVAPDGGVTLYEYDSRGNIVSVTDALDNTTIYDYNDLNQVIKAVNPEGNAICISYNLSGNMSKVVNADGNTRNYSYDKNGKLTQIVDWDGSTTAYEYNEIGKVSRLIDPLGGSTEYYYDKLWNLIRVVDAEGAEVNYQYDSSNRLRQVVDPEGYKTDFQYDPNGNLTSVTEPNGAITSFEYDALDRRVKVIDANSLQTSYAYDSFGSLVQVSDTLNGIYQCEYDSAGKLTSKTGPLGDTIRITNNKLGLVESLTDADGSTGHFEYDKLGKLIKFIGPDGSVESYEYNKNGKITDFIDALGNRYTYEYDSMDRIIVRKNPLGHEERFEFDAMDRVVKNTDQNGLCTHYRYNAAGHLIEIIGSDDSCVRYTYDLVNRLTAVEQRRVSGAACTGVNGNSDLISTKYAYDRRGLLLNVTDPTGGQISYEYDASGRRIKRTEKDGSARTYEYDPVGLLTRVTYADASEVLFSYNSLRKLVEMQDWLGTTTFTVDKLGRVIEVKDYKDDVISYSWTAGGKRRSITYPDNSIAEYEYDPSGRITGVFDGNEIASYKYDAKGYILERSLAKGIVTQYEYNEIGMPISLIHIDSDGELDRMDYTYDSAGKRITTSQKRRGIGGAIETTTLQYKYDAANRLCSVLKNGSPFHDYQYDSLGNRTSLEDFENGTTCYYEYDDLSRLIKKSDYAARASIFNYDPRGNLISIEQDGILERRFIFNAHNKMVESINSDGSSAVYTHDGFGRKVSSDLYQSDSSGSVVEHEHNHYALDFLKPVDNLLMLSGNTGTSRHIWGNEPIAEISDTGGIAYYLSDELRSVIRIMGDSGKDSLALNYDEYGVPTDECDKAIILGYTGYQYDSANRMYYAHARHYMPETGRFINEDIAKGTVFIPATLNPYSYCGNDPINYIDPNGMDRAGAAAYAQHYATDDPALRNPDYPSYGAVTIGPFTIGPFTIGPFTDDRDGSNNCTNFVSQCLSEGGGIDETGEWFMSGNTKLPPILGGISPLGWLEGKIEAEIISHMTGQDVSCNTQDPGFWAFTTNTWINADSQYRHFSDPNNGYADGAALTASHSDPLSRSELSTVQVGDLLYWDFNNDGVIDHATIIVGITDDGDILYAGNNDARSEGKMFEALERYPGCVMSIVRLKDEVYENKTEWDYKCASGGGGGGDAR